MTGDWQEVSDDLRVVKRTGRTNPMWDEIAPLLLAGKTIRIASRSRQGIDRALRENRGLDGLTISKVQGEDAYIVWRNA